MRLLLLSDLHLERAPNFRAADVPCDAVILAGDIHSPATSTIEWIREGGLPENVPIAYVLGNHEFYGQVIEEEISRVMARTRRTRVHVLAPGRLDLHVASTGHSAHVRVLGTTLWTDFAAPIEHDGSRLSDSRRAGEHAERQLADFHRIGTTAAPANRRSNTAPGNFARTFRAADVQARHQNERSWLMQQLRIPFDGPTVVVSHHAPCARSIAPNFAGDWLSPAFANDLPAEYFDLPTLWLHGHTHSSFDYVERGCRVVCNPRAPLNRFGCSANPAFDPSLIITISRRGH